jgi:putative transposase
MDDAFDNAMCESFFATLERVPLDRVRLRTTEEAETAVFEFMKGWYNSCRCRWLLSYHSPVEYKLNHSGAIPDTGPDLLTSA